MKTKMSLCFFYVSIHMVLVPDFVAVCPPMPFLFHLIGWQWDGEAILIQTRYTLYTSTTTKKMREIIESGRAKNERRENKNKKKHRQEEATPSFAISRTTKKETKRGKMREKLFAAKIFLGLYCHHWHGKRLRYV